MTTSISPKRRFVPTLLLANARPSSTLTRRDCFQLHFLLVRPGPTSTTIYSNLKPHLCTLELGTDSLATTDMVFVDEGEVDEFRTIVGGSNEDVIGAKIAMLETYLMKVEKSRVK